jgi:hypothetical protein
MTDSISINPLKMTDSFDYNYTESINDLKTRFKEFKKQISHLSLAIVFLVCSNFYLLYSASHLVNNSKSYRISYPLPDKNYNEGSVTLSGVEPHSEYVYETIPDLSTSQSKHVVNLVDYSSMDSDYKDSIFNNLDSIIVQDGDLGTSRHQITKVNWLFDESDTMLLYTALGEIFALAANGTISAYNTANGARHLLQSQVGWLEGKISDVIHHGSSYKEMRDQGKAYMKTRENKRREGEILRKMTEENNRLVNAEQKGEDITVYRQIIENLQDKRELVLNEREYIPIMDQKPIKEKTVKEFLQEQEVARITSEIEEIKVAELDQFKKQKEAEVEQIKVEKEAIEAVVDQKEAEVEQIKVEKEAIEIMLNSTKIENQEDMDSIKYDLDMTKADIEYIRDSIIQLVDSESDSLKKTQMEEIKQQLLNTNGKIAFTQMIIDEQTVSTYDKRPFDIRHHGNEEIHQYFENEEQSHVHASQEHVTIGGNIWEIEKENNISKFCSQINNELTCVCTNEISRDIYRCSN